MNSPLFNHLKAKLGKEVVVTFKNNLKVKGTFASWDFEKMWIEVETTAKMHFINMHKIVDIETPIEYLRRRNKS